MEESLSDNITYDRLDEIVNKMHANLAEQMLELFPTMVADKIQTMDEFKALELLPGDVVICYDDVDSELKPSLAWLWLGFGGKCMLMADTQTEDVDWFMNFGPVSIIRK